MFNKKPKADTQTVTISASSPNREDAEAADLTAPYRGFIEDLALVFPGIKRDPEELLHERQYSLLFWGRRPLIEYETDKVHAAAEVIRAEQAEKKDAERKAQGQAFVKELRK